MILVRIIFLFIILLPFSFNYIFCQKVNYIGNLATVFKEGNYKENYEAGLYYLANKKWKKSIKHFKRCDYLSKKYIIHFMPLSKAYTYIGDFDSARDIALGMDIQKKRELYLLTIKRLIENKTKRKPSKLKVDSYFESSKLILKEMKKKTDKELKYGILGTNN